MPIAGTPPFSPRADAVQRYLSAREDALLPRFVSRQAIACLWLLLAVYLGSAAAASLVRVPVYASGPAVVLDERVPQAAAGPLPVVAVFLPPTSARQVRVGQKLILDARAGRKRRIARVAAVEAEVRGPDRLLLRFSLSGAAAAAVTRPSVVALARWSGGDARETAAAHAGRVYRAHVEIGACRAISFLPGFGALSGGRE
jgi:hypothetical protein